MKAFLTFWQSESMTFDIEKARLETRGCENLIHFNNAGAALMPKPVADYLHSYLNDEELCGGYETANKRRDEIDNFYKSCALLLNCKPTEIAFVENATRAWDMAFYSFKFEAGDKILTSIAEYGSNVVAYIQQANRLGVEIVFVPNDQYGQVDVDALKNLLDEHVKLISMSHIPTGGGLVNPAAAIGNIANKHGIPYLLDSCQGVGQIPIDVDELGCDMLCGTGRKYLRGPRGTGFLYVRESLIGQLEPPFLDQHAATLVSPTEYTLKMDARRFENWEQNFAGKAALGVAVDYALAWGLENIKNRTYQLADYLRTKLASVANAIVTDEGVEQCGIVTFMIPNVEPTTIKGHCAKASINVTTSEGSGSLVSFQQRGLSELVRASVHYYNTYEEVDTFIEVLRRIR
jgi:cysteine desulfurase/selenocysteine lyase